MGGLHGEVRAETLGIDVTRRAESIGERISLGGDLDIPHLEFGPSWERDRPVTLPCHAVGPLKKKLEGQKLPVMYVKTGTTKTNYNE